MTELEALRKLYKTVERETCHKGDVNSEDHDVHCDICKALRDVDIAQKKEHGAD